MRKIHLLLILLFTALSIANAQQSEFKHCDTDFKWKEALKADPGAAERNQMLREFRKRFEQGFGERILNTNGTVVYRIPIVFHIIHMYGSENISKAQVLDAMDILNQSFQKLNNDTGQVIPLFQPIFANAQIEFVLPSLDPAGNCTDGITRTYSPLTADAGDNVKSLVGWPADRYLNIWVVRNIASGAAGYAYYPGISASIDGIVILHDYVGGIGTSNGSNYSERSLAHEVGHWLDLPHTWGSTNYPGDPSNCNIDDGIGDTPNTIGVGNFSCNTAQSTCGAIDNVQNYMDYASCHYMFTEGQKAAMHATLNSSVGNRDNLSTLSNWVLTGTEQGVSPAVCVPVADFSNKKRAVCAGSSISFKDVSWNGEVLSRTWQFPGGTPSTDTSANPVVQYNTPGLYNVTLTVTTSAGTDILTRSGIVEVLPYPGTNAVPYSESFEAIPFPGNEWAIDNPDNNNAWALTSAAGATGAKSLRLINQSGNAPGSVDAVISPTFNLSGVSGTMMTFKYAYAAKNASDSSELKVYFSSNCGDTWTQRFAKKGVALRTAANTTGNYVPQPADWSPLTVNMVSGTISGKPSVRIKFEFTNVAANNIYIDDININGTVASAEVLSEKYALELFPNPSRELLNIRMQLDQPADVRMVLRDMSGRVIEERKLRHPGGLLNEQWLRKGFSGMALMDIQVNDDRIVRKLSFMP